MKDDTIFQLDLRGERQVAWLRLTGAVVCLAGAFVIASIHPPAVGWVVVVVGLAAGVGWMIAGRRGLARARDGHRYFVALRAEVLEVHDGTKELRVAWRDVVSASVDEERLVVVVRRRDADPVHVEPRFAGVSVYDLARAIDERADPERVRP